MRDERLTYVGALERGYRAGIRFKPAPWRRYLPEALAALAAVALVAITVTVLVADLPPPGVLGVAKAWLFCDAGTLAAGCP